MEKAAEIHATIARLWELVRPMSQPKRDQMFVRVKALSGYAMVDIVDEIQLAFMQTLGDNSSEEAESDEETVAIARDQMRRQEDDDEQ